MTARKIETEKDEKMADRVPTTMRDFFFEDPHFKTNWDQFDSVKDSMFKESRDLWKEMDKDFRQTRCMQEFPSIAMNPTIQADNPLEKYEQGWMFPRKWMMPAIKSDFADADLFSQGHDHDVIRLTDDDKKLEVSLDTAHYKPEELHVQVKNNSVVIEGSHEEKSKDGKSHVTRKFTRAYTLPKGTRSEDVTSNLSSDGVLVVKVIKHEPIQNVEIKKIK